MKTAVWIAAAAVLALAGCEKAQDSTQAKKKPDAPAWQGGSNTAYVDKNWTAGDATSWEKQMTNRAQAQNEYARLTGK